MKKTSKMQFFTILFIILLNNSSLKTQTVECDYGDKYFWTTGLINQNNSFYSCYAEINNLNSIDKVTNLIGQHNSNHNDDDVMFFSIAKDNNIKTLSSIFCKTFKNLKAFRAENSEIHSIDGNTLENCKNLDILDIAGTKIRYLPKDLLMKNSKLTQIWFRVSQVSTLPETLFLLQNNLKVLSLNGNEIKFLPSKVFHPLVELQVLYLQMNKLQLINLEWFKNLQNLKWLFLNDNQISNVPAKSFKFLQNLEELYLYSNKIKSLGSNSFDGLQNLKILNLYGNEISELPHNVFSPLTSLQELSLYSNNLSIVHAASFGTHKKLTDIYLGSNKINQIDEKLIDNTAVNFMNMESNICSNERLNGSENIKIGLKRCFENHKNKIQELLKSLVKVVREFLCGKPARGIGNIIGGQHVARGDFPWVTALVTPNGQYFCGGTLVSNRKVVTAAHCIQDKHAPFPKLSREIIVQLGAYDLNRIAEVGRVSHAVQNINVHPDWNTLTEPFDADIAVLVLEREVIFSELIHPICLASIQVATVMTGIVVGYGKSEDITKVHENIPKAIETPIHTNEHCFLENSSLARISSKRTFCGGTGTGVGVCRGDSGSGLFVANGSAYYLRGIVSSSIIGGRYGCDVDTYSVFTDVTKYAEWINEVSTDRFV